MGRFGERIQSVYHSILGINLGNISGSISMILLEVMAPHLRRAIHIWSVWLFSPFPHFPTSPLPTFGPHPIVPNMLHVNSNWRQFRRDDHHGSFPILNCAQSIDRYGYLMESEEYRSPS